MDQEKELEQVVSEETEQTAAQDVNTETELQAEQLSLENEVKELKDKYLRLFAEFDNYKKRTTKEKIENIKYASQDMLQALLPVLDDFERAQKLYDKEENESLFPEGMRLIYHKLLHSMKQKGLTAMESDGVEFNAEFHEAVTEIPVSDEMKGKVVDTLEKGYYLHDKIIRFAKVVVGQK